LSPQILVEPFVGGGSVFLHFLSVNDKNKVIIGDKDELIYSFWKTVFNNPDSLISFIRKVKINLNNFEYYRSIADSPSKYSVRELAEACIFLNRTSFSGILNNSAGPIGGKKQKSVYKIDCRFNKVGLIKQIKKISKYRKRVTVIKGDWVDTMNYAKGLNQFDKNSLFFYIDPPFYNKAEKLYRYIFNHDLHKRLRNKLVALKYNWVLSYDKAKEVKELYSQFKPIHVEMAYSINSPAKRLEKEYIITPLNLPKLRNKNKKDHSENGP
jgi:DNA adenine methylase